MDSDLSLIEISGEDDSLLRLEDPTDGIFLCSPFQAARSADAAPETSSAGPVRSLQFAGKIADKSGKENADVKADGTKLNMDPLQMKRRKKAAGYNMRKSLAWNKAFFTEEGVLDPEELSLVTGSFNLSSGEPLSAIQEERRKPGKKNSPHVQSPKEKMLMRSPGIGRGLSPRCDSSTRHRVSPIKEISSPHVRRLLLSAHDANRKGEKHGGCPRPAPSSSYPLYLWKLVFGIFSAVFVVLQRPATANSSIATSKEPKLKKPSVPRADRCSPPMVSRSTLPTASSSSRILAEAKRVVSAPKLAAVADKSSIPNTRGAKSPVANTRGAKSPVANTRGVKGSVTNTRGVKGIAKSRSSTKPSQLPGRNKSELPPKAPTPRAPQVPHASVIKSVPLEVPDQARQEDEGKCLPNVAEKQATHVPAAKPTGLRMPSPSLGFFGLPKQRDSTQHNDSTSSSSYAGVRNVPVAQRPLKLPGRAPRAINCILASDELRCLSSNSNVREPVFIAKSVEMDRPIMTSENSPVVQADFLEKCSQTISQKPGDSNKCDETVDTEDLCTPDNLPGNHGMCSEQLQRGENQGKTNHGCGDYLKDKLSPEGYNISVAENQGYSGHIQPETYDDPRSMHDLPVVDGAETRKPEFSEARQKKCEESLDEDMDCDPSPPQLKHGESQGIINGLCRQDSKDSMSPEAPSVCEAETHDSGDHIQPLTYDGQKSLHESCLLSVEGAETSKPDSGDACQETCKESLNGNEPDSPEIFQMQLETCISLTIQEVASVFQEDATNCLSMKDEQSSSAEAELVVECKMPRPRSQFEFEHVVEDTHQVFSQCDTELQRNIKDGLVEISDADCDQMVNEGVQSFGQADEIMLQEVGVLEEDDAANLSLLKDKQSGCVEAEFLAECRMPSPGSQSESEDVVEDMHQIFSECEKELQLNRKDDLLEVSNSDCGEMVDGGVLSIARINEITLQHSSEQVTEDPGAEFDVFPSSQLADLDQVNVVQIADASTTRDFAESPSSAGECSEIWHQVSSEDQLGMHDVGLDVEYTDSQEKPSPRRSTDLDELARNVTETTCSKNDTEVERIQDDTSSTLEERGAPSPCTRRSSKSTGLVIKPPPNAVPFSEEWLAAMEAAGEDILTLKSGAVQHSPPDKSIPEPSPWSPVKRYKNQGIGPFDCTKHTNAAPPPADDY
uniref:Uncharacterized protein n=1 Tax=Kalanchoe fedtschenkoi TaxID=63787 RepID=A0A7N0SVH9_KALFE